MRENGYEGMPPVEETLASYLSVGETSSLKAPLRLSFCGILLGHQVSSTAIPGPAGLFTISSWQGTPLIEEGARLSEYIYVLAQGMLPFLGFLSSNLPEPLPKVCFSPARL